MVDTKDLKSFDHNGCVGSTPTESTIWFYMFSGQNACFVIKKPQFESGQNLIASEREA